MLRPLRNDACIYMRASVRAFVWVRFGHPFKFAVRRLKFNYFMGPCEWQTANCSAQPRPAPLLGKRASFFGDMAGACVGLALLRRAVSHCLIVSCCLMTTSICYPAVFLYTNV